MRVFEVSSNIGESKSSLVLGHLSIEGIDPAVCYGISWRFAAFENRWQVF